MIATFYSAGILVAYSILMFARTVPGLSSRTRIGKSRGGILLAPVVGLITLIYIPSVFFTNVNTDGINNVYSLVLQPYIVYAIFFVGYIGWALYILYRKHTTGGGKAASQFVYGLKLVSVSIAFGTSINALTNLALPLVGIYSYIWIGPLVVIPMTVLIWYAILRHGFFDIRFFVVRTIGYVFSIGTLAIIYLLLAYLVSFVLLKGTLVSGVSFSPLNVLFALVLAFIFQPIKNFFDRITNSIFYRDRYKPEEFFALLSNVLSTTTDLRSLLERASDVIQMTFKSKQTFFFVRFGQGGHVTAGSRGHQTFNMAELHRLDELVMHSPRGIISNISVGQNRALREIFADREVSLLLPFWRDGSVLGYLALGEGLAGYSHHDYRVLETIADELVIAIQNALSLEQVREVNANLQDRIDEATHSLLISNAKLRRIDDTKDEFLSMASHQLRTPLTSVKGYVSMLLDGDAGPINEQQRKFLNEAFVSSNRMAGIIGDFLNVSRLQTGKFSLERELVPLADLVSDEVNHLKSTAKVRGLALHYHKPAHFPELMLDKSKMEQVIMNFIDNAIFYAPNTGAIEIELFQRAGKVVFTVRDYGIGVPENEQSNLFGKFYRATNARQKRPDGTGVGLYLAKKVIVAHKGSIIFESEEGKGSTFGFEIPLKAD